MNAKVTSETATRDPITYRAEATVTVEKLVGKMVFEGYYHGTENETRQEVKAEAKRLAMQKARPHIN